MENDTKKTQHGRPLDTPLKTPTGVMAAADAAPGTQQAPSRDRVVSPRVVRMPSDLRTRVVELAALPVPDMGDLAWMASPTGRLAIEIAAAIVPMDRAESAARRLIRAAPQIRAGALTPAAVLTNATRARPPSLREGRLPRLVAERLVAPTPVPSPAGPDPFPRLAAGLAAATNVRLADVHPERLAAAARLAVELSGPASTADRNDPLRRLRANGTGSRRLARALNDDLIPTHAAATRVAALLIGPEGRTDEGVLRWWATASPAAAPVTLRLRWRADLLDLAPEPETDENRRRRARRDARRAFAQSVALGHAEDLDPGAHGQMAV